MSTTLIDLDCRLDEEMKKNVRRLQDRQQFGGARDVREHQTTRVTCVAA